MAAADSDGLIDEDPPADVVTVRSSTESVLAFAVPAQTQALQSQRAALLQRVAEIETLLGFVSTSDDLSVRVAALERFVGLKP
jgi:hypothetical protein